MVANQRLRLVALQLFGIVRVTAEVSLLPVPPSETVEVVENVAIVKNACRSLNTNGTPCAASDRNEATRNTSSGVSSRTSTIIRLRH